MRHNSGKRGFFRSAMDAMIAAREREARRYVTSALLALDDETLKANGFSRKELEREGGVPYLF